MPLVMLVSVRVSSVVGRRLVEGLARSKRAGARGMFTLGAVALAAACGGAQKSQKPDVPEAPNMNARRFSALVERASAELDCPGSQLGYTYAQGLHHVAGCQRQADYVMYCSGWTCVWLDSPAKDAAFAINCPAAELQVTRIDDTKYGVSGCNQRIAYVVRCHGLQCGWVSDTVTTSSSAGSAESAAPVSSSVN